MRIQIPENWFYTNEPVRMPGDGERYAYHLVPGRDPRPGNFEDELVNDFLADTDQPEWVGDDVEGILRTALRRAADAAVRTTLDAEKPAGVAYETAEERATPSIVRRNPKLARQIRARRLNNSAPASNLAPARNRWSRAVWTANHIIKTIFAIIGAIAALVAALIIKGAQ